jgi:hypothetical protein
LASKKLVGKDSQGKACELGFFPDGSFGYTDSIGTVVTKIKSQWTSGLQGVYSSALSPNVSLDFFGATSGRYDIAGSPNVSYLIDVGIVVPLGANTSMRYGQVTFGGKVCKLNNI